jgi:hypothetical protein
VGQWLCTTTLALFVAGGLVLLTCSCDQSVLEPPIEYQHLNAVVAHSDQTLQQHSFFSTYILQILIFNDSLGTVPCSGAE